MSLSVDGPTLLVASVVAAALSTALVRATRLLAKRTNRIDELQRMYLGLALVLFGLLLICISLQRILRF